MSKGIVTRAQADNYLFFIEAGRGLIAKSKDALMSPEHKTANAELAKACARLADACKED